MGLFVPLFKNTHFAGFRFWAKRFFQYATPETSRQCDKCGEDKLRSVGSGSDRIEWGQHKAQEFVLTLYLVDIYATMLYRWFSFGDRGIRMAFEFEDTSVKGPTHANEWTVAIDLDVSFDQRALPSDSSKANQEPAPRLGGETKMAMLKELASETKGKPVTIVAQTILKDGNGPGVGDAVLTQYVIKDGSVSQIASRKAGSNAENIRDLVDTATHRFASNKIALVVHAHGSGDRGLKGNDEHINLAEFSTAVARGLSGSGHEKLDILDFDSCMMAQTGVLHSMSRIANDLVAPADVEWVNASSGMNGQNLNLWLVDLLNKPSMDGKDLGQAIVREAAQLAPIKNASLATQTMSHFDLNGNYNQFSQSFEAFADALTKNARNSRNRTVLESLIKTAPRYLGQYSVDENGSKADLRSFADGVLRAIASNKLDDPKKELRLAAMQMEAQQARLVQSYYGAPMDTFDYRKMGGLNVYLPQRSTTSRKELAKSTTTVGELAEYCSPNAPFERRKSDIFLLPDLLAPVDAEAGRNAATSSALVPVRDAIKKLTTSADMTDAQIERTEESLCSNLQGVQKLEPFASQWHKTLQGLNKDHKELLASEKYSPGWSKFLAVMK